ncbi:hypothetical protein PV416_20530 [Streptomyces ipomoeae]|jgi:hypothetical protein|uniref:Uncharacterized protein n=1 Tax=Streptomyces ipomoeae 91-03 TaxID=698759 RepID=L1L754_9ACTN|nr:hypothetical protein [Streptomyces ipomoeae]EKX68861.1 hypothetical protein STRIP9103_03861 [Streptomyces ipomoeae 91-03]MDX2696307.1 hypothetical protein [Streptomyces ipomoeae]MDX2823434.1 hypothetical protein [Streptomyces ipomoeae]MDX2839510.1 hypothetical protein [Streptomyces ipomoeae]MDX2876372.1 hypothetical protein [Streptomyces ipomoeae]
MTAHVSGMEEAGEPREADAAARADGGPAPPYSLAGLWAVRHGQSTANVAYEEAERTGSTVPLPGRGAPGRLVRWGDTTHLG